MGAHLHQPLPPALDSLPPLAVEDLGLKDYGPVHRYQRQLVDQVKAQPGLERLLLVEHPEVYTFGRRSEAADSLADRPCFAIERGGQATYHNPGQLVAYPILRLEGENRDLHRYLRGLEEVLIGVLRDFDLSGERRPGATGVWISGKEKKIASLGVAVSSWVTYHGTALNVENDLRGFARISPCGFSSEVMTSLKEELGQSPGLDRVKQAYTHHFCRVFKRRAVPSD